MKIRKSFLERYHVKFIKKDESSLYFANEDLRRVVKKIPTIKGSGTLYIFDTQTHKLYYGDFSKVKKEIKLNHLNHRTYRNDLFENYMENSLEHKQYHVSIIQYFDESIERLVELK